MQINRESGQREDWLYVSGCQNFSGQVASALKRVGFRLVEVEFDRVVGRRRAAHRHLGDPELPKPDVPAPVVVPGNGEPEVQAKPTRKRVAKRRTQKS